MHSFNHLSIYPSIPFMLIGITVVCICVRKSLFYFEIHLFVVLQFDTLNCVCSSTLLAWRQQWWRWRHLEKYDWAWNLHTDNKHITYTIIIKNSYHHIIWCGKIGIGSGVSDQGNWECVHVMQNTCGLFFLPSVSMCTHVYVPIHKYGHNQMMVKTDVITQRNCFR